MDTIGLRVEFKNYGLNIGVEDLRRKINNIKSTYGHTYCDFLNLNNENTFTIKLSYPRFFEGVNIKLVENSYEVLEVNKHFTESLYKIAKDYNASEVYINLIRVDIPFTYIKPKDMDFSSYQNVFRALAIIYTKIKNRVEIDNVKGIINMIDLKLETVNFFNNSGNIEVCIYNQYLNIKRKTNDIEVFNGYKEKCAELRNRIRIEVRRRIKRKAFILEEFSNFDILKEYAGKHRKFILKYLFNKQELNNMRENLIKNLDSSYKTYIKYHGRINYVAWLNINRDNIFDYSIVREVLKKNISSPKTLESAVTIVRRELKSMSNSSIGCFDMIDGIRRCIKNYKFNFSDISENKRIEETVQMREYYIEDKRYISEEELDCIEYIEDVF